MWNRIKRLVKHRWLDGAARRHAISPDMLQRLKQRVAASEQRHSGEIRIAVESSLPTSYLWRKAPLRQIVRQRAVMLFGKLRVWDTAHNNGVLIYLLLSERAIELVADRGLNEHVTPKQWQDMVERMRSAFRQARYEDGLTQALEEVSAVLVRYFPLAPGESHRNELPDMPIVE
jgi:uncharacterized membrane protein